MLTKEKLDTVLSNRSSLEDQETLDQFLADIEVFSHNPDNHSLYAFMWKDFLKEYHEADEPIKKDLLNKKLDKEQKINDQAKYSGRTLYYSKMKIGNKILGDKISVCPKCGRRGVVYQNLGYYHSTDHIVKVNSGMGMEILDSCHLDTGLPWGEGFDDE